MVPWEEVAVAQEQRRPQGTRWLIEALIKTVEAKVEDVVMALVKIRGPNSNTEPFEVATKEAQLEFKFLKCPRKKELVWKTRNNSSEVYGSLHFNICS